MLLHGEHGAAWRRRQRRLRSWWRHEQQSVAMALSRSPQPPRWQLVTRYGGLAGTEDGQGRGGCAPSSTETEDHSSRGSGVVRVV